MRNLRVVGYDAATVGDEDLPLTASAWDTSNESVICAFGPTPEKPLIELRRKARKIEDIANDELASDASKWTKITSWDAPCPIPELACDEILLMQYSPLTSEICIVLAGGDLIVVRERPKQDEESVEIVGSIDVGIAAAAWAPDAELLAIVTKADNLVLMSKNLEPLTETAMLADDLQTSSHVSVGWGKKETQFQGKRAKAMRDPTMPEHIEEGEPSPYETGAVAVSWRGDGAFLAINAVVANERRAIRVYSREGALDSVSEPVDGLEAALSWRPSGNLIASIKRSSGENAAERLEVVFFERNGLRHGSFSLRMNSSEADEKASRSWLTWNLDSSILAVSLQGSVQLWTMGNYHYYLKQELSLPDQTRLPSIKWHAEDALRLCMTTSRTYSEIDLQSHVARGSLIPPHDHGVVAVIDGTTLKLTPLRQAGVPPPMAFVEVSLSYNIVDCAISPDCQKLVVLTCGTLELLDWKTTSTTPTQAGRDQRYGSSVERRAKPLAMLGQEKDGHLTHLGIAFAGSDEIVLSSYSHSQSQMRCSRIMLDDLFSNSQLPNGSCRVQSTQARGALLQNADQQHAWVYSKALMQDLCIPGAPLLSLPEDRLTRFSMCSVYAIAVDASPLESSMPDQRVVHYVVQLSHEGHLRAGERLITQDCTSYAITDQHLIFTTSQHLLKFVHLTHPESIQVPGDTTEVDERSRSIERGAKIVTVIPSIYAVVLQMPRGNLETIYPRVLVLSGIRDSLQDMQYRKAFLACQSQQVDMNIIYDYLPAKFMANIGRFIEDVKKPGRIDEFLSKLKDEDVSKTLYKDTLRTRHEAGMNGHTPAQVQVTANGIEPDHTSKVNRICSAFISVLSTRSNKHLQNIVTAHVCKRPPDLPAALTLVSTLHKTSPEDADVAISHLCFLTDTNRLFDAALALYDLELTLLVAQNSQRDPREYMPFLQELQASPAMQRQYKTDTVRKLSLSY